MRMSLRKNEEEQKMQGIRMEVRSAFLRHREAMQRVEALKLSVRQAEENYRIMQNRYLNQLAGSELFQLLLFFFQLICHICFVY